MVVPSFCPIHNNQHHPAICHFFYIPIYAVINLKCILQPQKIQNRELAGYFSYAVGQCLSFGLVGSFILYFYTDILGISPAAAGAIFLVARIWDAINDPLIAGYMDTLNFKRGKFTPYMWPC